MKSVDLLKKLSNFHVFSDLEKINLVTELSMSIIKQNEYIAYLEGRLQLSDEQASDLRNQFK